MTIANATRGALIPILGIITNQQLMIPDSGEGITLLEEIRVGIDSFLFL